MATIASLLVVMGMDTKGLTAGAAKAEGSLAGVGASTSKFGSIADKAFLGAGVAVAAFGVLAVKSATEAAEAHLKLTNTFENNAMLSDRSVESFEAQADALRQLTGVDDEAIIGAQALLGQFKLTGSEVEQLIPRIVDLSAKMGIDLEAAAKAVGKATQGNASILSRYGIVLDETALKTDAFGTTLKGLGVAQGFAADRAKIEPWRVLGSEFEEIAEDVGTVLLPFVRGLARVLGDLLPVVKVVASNLDILLAVLTGYFALRALPAILHGVETALIAVQAASGASLTSQIAVTAAFAGGTTAAVGWVAAAAAIPGIAFLIADALAPVSDAQQIVNDRMKEFAVARGPGYARAVEKVEADTAVMQQKAELAAGGIANLSGSFEAAEKHAVQLGEKLGKAAKAIRDDLVAEIPNIIGSVTRVKDAFDITPKELQAITHHWATIAHTIASDLREIARSDLTPAMRQAISALPPEMRHAWVEGNQSQRAAIIGSIKETYKVQDQMPALARQALTGGHTVGVAMDQGIQQGIESGVGRITTAATNAVNAGLAAARRAAQAESPSKKMEELGHDMISGLVNGLIKNQNALLAAAEKVMTALQDKLSKVLGKASSFGQGIQGGFSSLLSFPTELPEGMDIQGFFQSQLGQARNFADILQMLKTQGAGKGLLAEIASQGPAAIPMAQQLLQSGPAGVQAANKSFEDIARIAEKIAGSLTNQFFGDRIDALRRDVKDQKDVLVDIKQSVKFLEKINDQLSSGEGRSITINTGALLGTREEVLDWIRQGLVDAGRSGKGHH